MSSANSYSVSHRNEHPAVLPLTTSALTRKMTKRHNQSRRCDGGGGGGGGRLCNAFAPQLLLLSGAALSHVERARLAQTNKMATIAFRYQNTAANGASHTTRIRIPAQMLSRAISTRERAAHGSGRRHPPLAAVLVALTVPMPVPGDAESARRQARRHRSKYRCQLEKEASARTGGGWAALAFAAVLISKGGVAAASRRSGLTRI